jgi:hypothetical protein
MSNYPSDPLLDHDRQRNEILLSRYRANCQCGENRAAPMTRSGLCYACDLRKRGKSTIEDHHPFGHSVPTIFPLPANEHRVFDALRNARYRRLKEPSEATLANVAALMMQFVEIAEMQYNSENLQPWEMGVADKMIDWGREAVETLLELAGHLQAELGKNWEPRSWSP